MTPGQEQRKAPPIEQTPAEQSLVDGPVAGSGLLLKQQVADILATTPGGESLDDYFGVSSGSGKQAPAEAGESVALVDQLRAASQGICGDLASLLEAVSKHADTSGADPEALRALMRSSRKPRNDNEDKAG